MKCRKDKRMDKMAATRRRYARQENGGVPADPRPHDARAK
jgi:hypothetical protein